MWTTFALTLAGLGVSIYLTIDHFAKVQLVCPGHGGTITCKAVTTSAQSYFPPFHGWPQVPVAVLGLCFYAVLVAFYSPWAWASTRRWVHGARFGLICLGMAFALWLVSAELLIIDHICLWCTSVHVITFVLFVIIVATVPHMLGWGQYDEADEADGEPTPAA